MSTASLVISLIAMVFTGIVAVFTAFPYLDSLKPRLRMQIKGNGDKNKPQEVLEHGNLVFTIENDSKNTAHNIEINSSVKVKIKGSNEQREISANEEIPYLNPQEMSRFPFSKICPVLKEYSDLFESSKENSKEFKAPKEDLQIELHLQAKSSKNLNKYKVEDDFHIEWN